MKSFSNNAAKFHAQVKLMLLGKANSVSGLKTLFDSWGSRLKEWESDIKNGMKTMEKNWKDAQARFDGFAPYKKMNLMQKLAAELKDIEESDTQFFQKAAELQNLCNKIITYKDDNFEAVNAWHNHKSLQKDRANAEQHPVKFLDS